MDPSQGCVEMPSSLTADSDSVHRGPARNLHSKKKKNEVPKGMRGVSSMVQTLVPGLSCAQCWAMPGDPETGD